MVIVSSPFRQLINFLLLAQSPSDTDNFHFSLSPPVLCNSANSASSVALAFSLHGKLNGSSAVYFSRFTNPSFAVCSAAAASFLSSAVAPCFSKTAFAFFSAPSNSSHPEVNQSFLYDSHSFTSVANEPSLLSISLMVILAFLLNPRIVPSFTSVISAVKYWSPVLFVFLLVLTSAVVSVWPSSNTISGINVVS